MKISASTLGKGRKIEAHTEKLFSYKKKCIDNLSGMFLISCNGPINLVLMLASI